MPANKAFFIQRLNDHIQYLRRVTATLKGEDSFHGTSCTACKLGEWIYTDGRKDWSNSALEGMASFDVLEEKHKRFHEASNRALAQHRCGDDASSHHAMTEMYTLSRELVSLLLEADQRATRLLVVQ